MFPFFNREAELRRLRRMIGQEAGGLAVVYGRRRCGKSRLVRELSETNLIYFQADQREAPLQRQALAGVIARQLPGFDEAVYPDWEALLHALQYRLQGPMAICLDEFPYLVRGDEALPSILQGFLDRFPNGPLSILLCGSAQQMMRGLVLDASAPLYGRAKEILRIHPLKAYWLSQGFPQLTPDALVEEYAVWGGVPRYWELRQTYANLEEALLDLAFDPIGVLYEEPDRLFLDEARSAIQPLSIMSLVGSGSQRLSVIAARLEKPATQLARPLQFLTDLRFLLREVPFGESARNSKKGIYSIADPFLAFYFRFVSPNRSELELGRGAKVWERLQPAWRQHVAGVWETMCREALPALLPNLDLQPASRWWGKLSDGASMEIDLLATDTAQQVLVAGEVKWSDEPHIKSLSGRLDYFTSVFPPAKGKKIVKVLFARKKSSDPAFDFCFSPEEVLGVLR